jgi:hypothetical protein
VVKYFCDYKYIHKYLPIRNYLKEYFDLTVEERDFIEKEKVVTKTLFSLIPKKSENEGLLLNSKIDFTTFVGIIPMLYRSHMATNKKIRKKLLTLSQYSPFLSILSAIYGPDYISGNVEKVWVKRINKLLEENYEYIILFKELNSFTLAIKAYKIIKKIEKKYAWRGDSPGTLCR